jgi:hypothetical protein
VTVSEKAARNLYEAFHRHPPRKIGEFAPSFVIPHRVFKQGKAIDVLYRSNKVDPETLKTPRRPVDYIHEHDPGVFTYLAEGDGTSVATPHWVRDADALVLLGKCLGFKFTGPDGELVEAQGKNPLPELYATTNGKALLVIDDKCSLIAVMWGGELGVEPRGIVG